MPFFFWILLIFFNSTSNGSMNETSRFLRPLLEFFFPDSSAQTLTQYHGYIRKIAHLGEYGALGYLGARLFRGEKRIVFHKFYGCFALISVFVVASLDELYQSFNPLRTGTYRDVILDCIGGFIAVLAYKVLVNFQKN